MPFLNIVQCFFLSFKKNSWYCHLKYTMVSSLIIFPVRLDIIISVTLKNCVTCLLFQDDQCKQMYWGYLSIWYSRCEAFAYQIIILNFRGMAKISRYFHLWIIHLFFMLREIRCIFFGVCFYFLVIEKMSYSLGLK